MRRLITSVLLLLLFSGCIVVQSDATRLDDETGAFHIDLRSGGEETEESSAEASDEASQEVTEEVDDSKVSELRDKIDELERKVEQAETEMEIAEMESALAEEARDHEHQEAQRSVQEAAKDLELFHQFERLELIHNAQQGLASTESRFLDAQAELEQLTILYEGSELEDGTDELVLERGRRSLARAQESLDQERRDHRLAMEVEIPKKERDLHRAHRDAERALDRGERETTIAELRSELKQAEMERDLDEVQEQLEESRHDLRDLTVDQSESTPVVWRVF